MGDSAVGEDAGRLRERLQKAAKPDTSVTLGYEERLARAVADAASAGWDYADTGASAGAVYYARALMTSLSSLARDADAQIDPQGDVLLEWAASPRWILTVAINNSGRIAYSALLGDKKMRGMESFDGSIPVPISHAISRIRDRKAVLAFGGG